MNNDLPKRISTCRARLAFRRVELTELEVDDGRIRWLAARGSLVRTFDNVAELERWVDLVDGRRHCHATAATALAASR